MIKLTSSIEITDPAGVRRFRPIDFCHQIEINSSWEDMVSTCKITLPKVVFKNRKGTYIQPVTNGEEVFFRRGDQVKVSFGYDGKLTTRFEGIIAKVNPRVPIELHCEDDSFRLKESICKKKSWDVGVSLSDILSFVLPVDPRTGKQYKFSADPMTFGKFSINRSSVLELLEYFKKSFGLTVYFRDNTIFVGLAYQLKTIADIATKVLPVFHFQKNIIEDSLEYWREEDVKYRVTATNIKRDNSRKTFDFGNVDGELRSVTYYDVPDADVKRLATDLLNRFKFTGFRGTFTGFMDPKIQHGDPIRLQDDIIPDRNGTYLVKRVISKCGVDGGRQVITLDRIIS